MKLTESLLRKIILEEMQSLSKTESERWADAEREEEKANPRDECHVCHEKLNEKDKARSYFNSQYLCDKHFKESQNSFRQAKSDREKYGY